MSFAKWFELVVGSLSFVLFILAVYTGVVEKEYAEACFMLLLVVLGGLYSSNEESK